MPWVWKMIHLTFLGLFAYDSGGDRTFPKAMQQYAPPPAAPQYPPQQPQQHLGIQRVGGFLLFVVVPFNLM